MPFRVLTFFCRYSRLLTLILLMLPVAATGGITREPSAYRIESWAGDDGLPQSSVTTIAQTRDGYLWLGTFGGLARFDGAKFKVFDVSKMPKLPSSRVLSLFEGSEGALWVGTEDGFITRAAEGQLTVFHPPNRGTVSKFIKTFAQSDSDLFWMLSAEGQLVRFDAGHFIIVSTNWNLKGVSAQWIATDNSGQLWVGTEQELARWIGGKFVVEWDQAREPSFGVDGLTASSAGGIWVAGNGRLRRFNKGKWVVDMGYYPWAKGVLSQLHEDRQGQLWLGVYGSGVFRYATNGAVLNLSVTEGLPGKFVRSLHEDFEGNIWVGTEGHGLARIKRSVFRSYGREQGLSSDLVLSVCEGKDGELWIGTNGEGLNKLKNGAIEHYGANEGLTNECVWSVCQDRNKTLWAGTWGGGLFMMQGDRFVPFTGEGPCGPVICTLYEDTLGRMWLGQIRDGPELAMLTASRVTVPNQLPRADARVLLQDKAGNFWVGTRNDGLYLLNNNGRKRFGKKEGLSNESILSLYSDSDGTLWIGTRDGLNRLQDGKCAVFQTKNGLANGLVLSIAEDDRRNLWCGSGAGIFRVSKDELNNVACGQGQALRCFGYTRSDGLPSLECSSGCQPNVCKTGDGRIWFPTVNGLAVVDPENVPFNSRKPPVVIEEVLVEGGNKTNVLFTVPHSNVLEGEDGGPRVLRVAPGKPRFEFHYTALSLTAPEKVRFKYKLDGLENDWVDAGTERKAHYSYVRPGTYHFRVLACNNDGVWNETGASLGVIILPHFWQTWWFRVLAISCLLLLFVAAYEVRLGLERRVTRLRLRMARDLHDEVGSNLGTIALLSEVLSKEPSNSTSSTGEVSELRRVAVQTIDSLRDIVWFLDPAADKMSELVLRMKDTARTMLRGTNFEFESKGEMEAPAPSLELRRNLFPMFKEILHNIVRHAHATQVGIQVSVTSREFELRVQDNGVGFDEKKPVAGNGLKNLRRRAADLKGSLEIKSAPGEGTTITVRSPIP